MVLDMNFGASIVTVTITLSVVGLILAFLKFFKDGRSIVKGNNGFVNFSYLKDKLNGFVTKNGCTATVKGFEKILENHRNSYREELRLTVEVIRGDIKSLTPRIKETIQEEIKNSRS